MDAQKSPLQLTERVSILSASNFASNLFHFRVQKRPILSICVPEDGFNNHQYKKEVA